MSSDRSPTEGKVFLVIVATVVKKRLPKGEGSHLALEIWQTKNFQKILESSLINEIPIEKHKAFILTANNKSMAILV